MSSKAIGIGNHTVIFGRTILKLLLLCGDYCDFFGATLSSLVDKLEARSWERCLGLDRLQSADLDWRIAG